jgi:MFS family permease
MTDLDTTQTPPASPSLAMPKVGVRYRVGFTLASFVPGISSVALKQLIIPLQVAQLDPAHTYTSFAMVASIGAVAGLIASPLSGALSDRTISRFGRRRPWIAGGIIVAAIGLSLMAVARDIWLLLLGGIVEQIGVDTILSTVTALIPDQVPERQYASTSALNGMAPIFGGVIGLGLVTGITNTKIVTQGYLLLTFLSCACIITFLGVLREGPVRRVQVPSFQWKAFLAGFLNPLASRDFVLTLVSRLLVFLAFTTLGSFLLFYLRAAFHLAPGAAAEFLTLFQLLSNVVLAVVAISVGVWSKRSGRIKPFVVAGALLMALGLFVIVLTPNLDMLGAAAVLFGAGFGSYLGVDIHLSVKVLPSVRDRGKDLGIIHTAIFLPLIISPWIGAATLNAASSFSLLFTLAGLFSIGAALFILPIKAVR